MNVIAQHTEAFMLELNTLTRAQAKYLMDMMQNSIYGQNPEDEPDEITELRCKVFSALTQQLHP